MQIESPLNPSVLTSRTSSGFSLVELLVVVVIGVLLLTLATPGFGRLIGGNQLVTNTNALIGAMALARSEAIKRGARVTLCKGVQQCQSNGDFSQGWILYADADSSGTVSNADTVVRTYAPLPIGLSAIGTGAVQNYISFDSDGIVKQIDGSSQAGTIALCSNEQRSCVQLTRVGRAYSGGECTCP